MRFHRTHHMGLWTCRKTLIDSADPLINVYKQTCNHIYFRSDHNRTEQISVPTWTFNLSEDCFAILEQ